jgi:hypothetical protein
MAASTAPTGKCLIIRLADHKCDSLTGFFVNDEYVPTPATAIIAALRRPAFRNLFPRDTTNEPLPSVVTRPRAGLDRRDIGESGCDVVVATRPTSPTRRSRLARRPPALRLRRQGQALL